MEFAAHADLSAIEKFIAYAEDVADHYHAMPRPSFILGVHDGNPAKRRKAKAVARDQRERIAKKNAPLAPVVRTYELVHLPAAGGFVRVLVGPWLRRTVFAHGLDDGRTVLATTPGRVLPKDVLRVLPRSSRAPMRRAVADETVLQAAIAAAVAD